MSGRLPVEIMIEKLATMARAPREDWLRLSHEIEAVKLNSVLKGGAVANMIGISIKGLARQMQYAHPINDTELRGILLACATVMQNEVDLAATAPKRSHDTPYYVRD